MAIRKTRRAKRPDFTTLSMNQQYEMLTGRGWLVPGMSGDDMHDAWAIHADELRAEWTAKHGPGTRCFAEWFCEIIPRYGERATTKWWTAEHEHFRAKWLVHGILHVHTVPPIQEPEHVFLFRADYIGEAEYRAAKAIYDAAHEGDDAFFDGVLKRAAKWEHDRQERLHEATVDDGDCPCPGGCKCGETDSPQLIF